MPLIRVGRNYKYKMNLKCSKSKVLRTWSRDGPVTDFTFRYIYNKSVRFLSLHLIC